jgi:hypothetical protein
VDRERKRDAAHDCHRPGKLPRPGLCSGADMMEHWADLIRDAYEPVQPGEFRCFAAVGIVLAMAVLMMCGASVWTDAYSTAPAVVSDLARR